MDMSCLQFFIIINHAAKNIPVMAPVHMFLGIFLRVELLNRECTTQEILFSKVYQFALPPALNEFPLLHTFFSAWYLQTFQWVYSSTLFYIL